MIFTDDHQPAHVHAIGPDGEARIELGDAARAPRLIWIRGAMRRAEVRRALAEVSRERSRLRAAWRRIHEDGRP